MPITRGDIKDELESIVNSAIPGGDMAEATEEERKKVCNDVLNFLEATVNPDKKTYPSIKF